MGDGGVAAAGEERLGALAVVEEAHRDHAAEGVVHLDACLEGFASAGGFAEVGLQVAFDGALVAYAEVEPHVEVVSYALLAAAVVLVVLGVLVVLIVLGVLILLLAACIDLFAGFLGAQEAEEVEVVDFVAPADDEVFGTCLGELCARHAEVEYARGLVLDFERHVVVEGGVDADEGGEALVDADRADVEEAVGRVGAGGGVLNEAESACAHALLP